MTLETLDSENLVQMVEAAADIVAGEAGMVVSEDSVGMPLLSVPRVLEMQPPLSWLVVSADPWHWSYEVCQLAS